MNGNWKPSRSALASSSVLRRGVEDDVHAPDRFRLVVIDFEKHDVLLQAHGIIAAAIEAFRRLTPRKSRTRGSAMVIRRSRNSYMRSPRSVTFTPTGRPSRILNVAIAFLARVMTAFWPAMAVRSFSACLDLLAVRGRLARADIQHDLVRASAPAMGSCSRTSSSAPGGSSSL